MKKTQLINMLNMIPGDPTVFMSSSGGWLTLIDDYFVDEEGDLIITG